MIKIQKIGPDGKMHDYWQYTEKEIAIMKKKVEERKQRESKD